MLYIVVKPGDTQYHLGCKRLIQ